MLKINKNIIVLIVIFATSLYACKDENKQPSIIEIGEKEFNFGEISMNDSIQHTFVIKNTSDIPLQITKVGTSCGCTTSEYTKKEVLKNELAMIDVVFKPNKIGLTDKSIVVESNTDPPFNVFYIKGNVIE